MTRTRLSSLLLAGLVALGAGVLAASLIARWTAVWPAVPWTTTMLMGFLAVALVVSRNAVLRWREAPSSSGSMDPLRAARMLVLGRAAAWFGALSAGAYSGFLLAVTTELARPYGREVAVRCAVAAAMSLVVCVTGVLLERACEVRPPEDEVGSSEVPPSPV